MPGNRPGFQRVEKRVSTTRRFGKGRVYWGLPLAEVLAAERLAPDWRFSGEQAGHIVGLHRKIYLTKEKGFTEAGTEHQVFDVKGIKMGIAICADGSVAQLRVRVPAAKSGRRSFHSLSGASK